MLNAIKSEFTKILTLRATYIVSAVLVGLAALVGFLLASISSDGAASPEVLNSAVQTTFTLIIAIFSIVASMVILNEYRHNTIAYTITSSRSRYEVFIAKVIAAVSYGMVVSFVVSAVAVLAATIGLAASGNSLSDQQFDIGGLLLHQGLHVFAYILVGLFLGFILRNIIILIVIVFVMPILETASVLLLKDGVQYLPFASFTMLSRIGDHIAEPANVLLAFLYLIGLGALAFVLFIKRDA